MGYDKPDLGFVVHYQAPGSVISYYQQVGRAGRGVERAEVVLLRGAEDRRIQDFFIQQAFPPRELVDRVLARLEDGGATARDLMAEVNLGRGRIDALLKVLDVEGAVQRDGSRWSRLDSDWTYDAERYARVTALRRREQEAMAAFGADGRCLMRALQEELDDPEPQDCGRCSVCAGPRYAGPLDPALVREAALLLRSRPIVLETKKMAPDETGAMRKIPEDVRAEEGRALARLGDGGWDPVVQAGRRGGRLRRRAGRRRRRGRARLGRAGASGSPPCRRRSMPDFARRLAEKLGLPYAPALERVAARPPQREMANSAQQVANVRGAFAVTGELPAGRVPARRRRALQRLDAGDGRRPAPTPRRAGGLPVRADERVLSLDSRRLVRQPDRLRLRRAALAQVDAQHDHRADGEELGLPVLQGALPELGRADVLHPSQRSLRRGRAPRRCRPASRSATARARSRARSSASRSAANSRTARA